MTDSDLPGDAESEVQTVPVSDAMRTSVVLVREALVSLLRVGARNAGILLQSGLLRAGHSCRASNLHALSNTVLRIAEGVHRFRLQSDEADSFALKEDITTALFSCHSILHQPIVPKWIIGQSRREFISVNVRKLNGLFAEPILTRSGFAGVCVYLQEPTQGELYTVNELRPGNYSLILQAYRGGIDLGGLTQEAKAICRSNFAVQEMTVSNDGRLGKGKSTRWAITKRESDGSLSGGRFGNSIDVQIENVFSWMSVPSEQRPVGWDLIALTATVIGAHGPTVLVNVQGTTRPWRLGITIDAPELEYRHNLELIARCPRLQLRCLARVKVNVPLYADLLAISNSPSIASEPCTETRLELPVDWQGLCNTGLDRLERHFIRGINRWSDEVVLAGDTDSFDTNARFTTSLERRLVGMVLGGRDAVPSIGSKSHRRDRNQLNKLFLSTGSVLLDLLASTTEHDAEHRFVYESKTKPDAKLDSATAFLACDRYIRASQLELSISNWNN